MTQEPRTWTIKKTNVLGDDLGDVMRVTETAPLLTALQRILGYAEAMKGLELAAARSLLTRMVDEDHEAVRAVADTQSALSNISTEIQSLVETLGSDG